MSFNDWIKKYSSWVLGIIFVIDYVVASWNWIGNFYTTDDGNYNFMFITTILFMFISYGFSLMFERKISENRVDELNFIFSIVTWLCQSIMGYASSSIGFVWLYAGLYLLLILYFWNLSKTI